MILVHMHTVMYPKAKESKSLARWFIWSMSFLFYGFDLITIPMIEAKVIPKQTKVIEFDAFLAVPNASDAEYFAEYTILK